MKNPVTVVNLKTCKRTKEDHRHTRKYDVDVLSVLYFHSCSHFGCNQKNLPKNIRDRCNYKTSEFVSSPCLVLEPFSSIFSFFLGSPHHRWLSPLRLRLRHQVLIETGDLTDALSCRKLLEGRGPSSVFHLAGVRMLSGRDFLWDEGGLGALWMRREELGGLGGLGWS